MQHIAKSASVAVLTGAGISVPSGLAPFRGPGGLWNDLDVEQFVTADAFARNRAKVVGFLDEMREVARKASPNAAHTALARAEAAREQGARFDLITQNIDGLHTRGGSKRVHEIHGSLEAQRCEQCDQRHAMDRRQCTCGGRLRPDVVLFGEMLPEEAVRLSRQAVLTCDYFVAVGTSGVVWPAAGLVLEAKATGAVCLNVNVEPSGNEAFDEEIVGPAELLLPELFGV